MVLSNAERQRRYRERLKAAARGDDLAAKVEEVISAALAVIWHGPPENDAMREQFPTSADFRAWLLDPKQRKHRQGAAAEIEDVLSAYLDDVPVEKRSIIERALSVVRAAQLKEHGG